MGIGVLDSDDSLNVGLAGMHGRTSANRALAETDLLITLGLRFSDRVALNTARWGSQARIIQVDIDRSEVDKNIEVGQAIIGDVRDVLQALQSGLGHNAAQATKSTSGVGTFVAGAPGVGTPVAGTSASGASGAGTSAPGTSASGLPWPSNNWNAWLAQIAAWRADDYRPQNSTTTLKPHQLIEAICELAGPNAILTTDVGQHQMWAAQYCKHIRPRSFLTSGGLGTMGFGYGAAIGAQIGAGGGSTRSRPVIHITGDGSFHMNLNEACTAVSYRLPIITIIFNNQTLGMVRQLQKSFYDAHYSATTLDRATDYVKVAEGFGLLGMRARTVAEFRAALTDALAAEGPVWIECIIDRDAQVLPMIPAGGTVDDTVAEPQRAPHHTGGACGGTVDSTVAGQEQ
jgi:acetolactate synthase-1/2/3 large subunit